MNVSDLLPKVLAQAPPASRVELFVMTTAAPSGKRVVDLPGARPIVEEALELRRRYRVPFWEAVLLLCRKSGTQIRDQILDAAANHQTMIGVKRLTILAAELSPEVIGRFTDSLEEGQSLLVSSRLIAPGNEELHVPMLDFRIRPDDDNEDLAVEVIRRIGIGGTLLNSGNSYHFYGDSLLKGFEGLAQFLGRATLFSPFVDQRWIGHQMIEGSCALRISAGKTFQNPPAVVRGISL